MAPRPVWLRAKHNTSIKHPTSTGRFRANANEHYTAYMCERCCGKRAMLMLMGSCEQGGRTRVGEKQKRHNIREKGASSTGVQVRDFVGVRGLSRLQLRQDMVEKSVVCEKLHFNRARKRKHAKIQLAAGRPFGLAGASVHEPATWPSLFLSSSFCA